MRDSIQPVFADSLLSVRDVAPPDLNPRYWAYLEAGNGPCEPGRNARYMIWCQEQWRAFRADRDYRQTFTPDWMHDEFDRWLYTRLPVKACAA